MLPRPASGQGAHEQLHHQALGSALSAPGLPVFQSLPQPLAPVCLPLEASQGSRPSLGGAHGPRSQLAHLLKDSGLPQEVQGPVLSFSSPNVCTDCSECGDQLHGCGDAQCPHRQRWSQLVPHSLGLSSGREQSQAGAGQEGSVSVRVLGQCMAE